MGSQSALKSNKGLEGIHGVQVIPHSPFAVEEVTQNGDRVSISESSNSQATRQFLMKHVRQQISVRLRPVHCTCNLNGDQNIAETVANVVTSLPFIALGFQAPRQCLSRALAGENPNYLMAASALCLPFQPLMVSVVHTGLMEVAFAKRAVKDPELRMAHNIHKASSLLGGALFVADDVFPETPFLHAAWHLAAAVGVGTCNKLLE
ncbi:hypothetical protein KSS87_006625 [Heliosperma pusillum]|nr:hypothetical protein KSS87_006625 [Heliosperma pusillum]